VAVSAVPASPARSRASVKNDLGAYSRYLLIGDIVAITAAIALAHIIRFSPSANPALAFAGELADSLPVTYVPLSILGALIWLGLMKSAHVYSTFTIGAGTQEYQQIIRVALEYFGGLAILSYLLKAGFSRAYFLIVLPLGVTMLLLNHWGWRQWLVAQRAKGRFTTSALLVGGTDTVTAVAKLLTTAGGGAGYRLLGACTPDMQNDESLGETGLPVLGGLDDAPRIAAAHGASTVILTGCSELTPTRVKRLSWGLESAHRHLVMVPSLMDFTSSRITTQPVAGLPLIHIGTPTLDRRARLIKRSVDLLLAPLALLITSPLLLAAAIAIKLDDRGPVLFRQTRVGESGETFTMYKFRSMTVDAEQRLADLKRKAQREGAGNDILFKMKHDPRITRVGRFIRKSSVDELPQLFNVLQGTMSLVGPRPSLPEEATQYDLTANRRLNAKPGITGLWQVSGRSNLTWEQSIRLDLYYVENWSLVGDLLILFKTVREMVHSTDAY
jgi:exopolysaccharide biosynthesis polyprenyl glycosylphosphotransferase